RQSWFYYDNQANTAAPIKGFLTKKEDWAGGGTAVNPVTLYSYDAVGNLLTTTDPKGNITSVVYDTTYKMFPLTTGNALAHKVLNEYFGVNGVPLTTGDGLSGLWGQVRSTTDPNQQQGKRSYDIFGRVTTTIAPLDSVAYPTQTTEIQYNADYTKVTTRQRVKSGQAQTIDTVSFYDGLGRLIQTKTPSEVLGRYVVGGQAEYDSRGLKTKQYLPYFSANPVDTIEAINSTGPRSTIEYDAMGRAVKTINPDGTYASAAYDDWMTTATDENGHKQASYFDAWGRLVKKEEYTGADGRSPNYPAKPYTLYAATLYSYDCEGNLLQTKDAYNNITTITYDVLGRKIAMAD
ncbi:MAG: YD repeat-containing protein, partial [Gammaproteobacteria bacterium]